ncbi:MAG: TPM domain-containing protein [Candidatus Faecousia sp.]|nr:TPM domain-containing protein [Candidatus Faecousia sp.]
MKKRLFCLLAAALLLAAFVLPAAAAETPERYIYDVAELLTEEEYWELNQRAQEISEARQCAVYFVTVEDYTRYGDGTVFDVATHIFEENGFGMGQDKSGVMLILSIEDRDYCLLAHGFGDTALTDYGKDFVSERFLDDFGDDDWYGGCMDYLTYTDSLLTQAREGNVYDVGSWITGGMLWLWSLIFGLVLALVVCLCQRAVMRKKLKAPCGAFDYAENGSLHITRRDDRYTHTTQIRREIKSNTSDGAGGGSYSHSGGYSGKSGKF